MNRKQQATLNQQVIEKDTLKTRAASQIETIAERISTCRLILGSHLNQADINLLADQLANKSSREQINILELWFDWAETAAKVEVQESASREVQGTRYLIEVLQMRQRRQRDALEAR